MTQQKDFETLLTSIADAPVGSLGPDDGNGNIDENQVLHEIRLAKERLKADPSLFSGDPNRFFTYDDPVLAIMAYLYQSHAQMARVVGVAGPEGANLQEETFWKWAKTGVYMWRFRNSKSYDTLMGKTPREDIVIPKEVMRIGVAGDAGYFGQAQTNIIYNMREIHRHRPYDLLVHLGDIYFAGHGEEFLKHFLAPFMNVGPRVLTLVGNHDLYMGADSFLHALKVLKQPGRYFCIENPHWRIACLDTALPASSITRNAGRLDEGQLDWLDSLLDKDDGKKNILMSHHFVVSGWEKTSDELMNQLQPRLKKVFAWYWGHEHRSATYSKSTVGYHGACIGNGVFLEPWEAPTREPQPDWYPESRCACYGSSDYWPHGYLDLELQPTRIIENYHLENGDSHTRTLEVSAAES
jgi:hypothetical protein